MEKARLNPSINDTQRNSIKHLKKLPGLKRQFYKNYGEDRSAKYGETEKIWPKYGENKFKY